MDIPHQDVQQHAQSRAKAHAQHEQVQSEPGKGAGGSWADVLEDQGSFSIAAAYPEDKGGSQSEDAASQSACSEPEEREPWHDGKVAAGLSNLGRTAGGGTAYLRLTVAGTDLRDARALARCAHVEDMQLPGNRLACVAALGALSGLASLNVSGNELTRLLDLGQGAPAPAPACGRAAADPAGAAGRRGAPPPAAGSLRDADFGFNKIAVIRDLSGFSRLDRLVLDGNQVERVGRGLSGLVQLRWLGIKDNLLETCEGLQALAPSLRTLLLDGNRLSSLAPLAALRRLEVLVVARNRLRGLRGLEGLPALRRVDAGHNLIGRLEDVGALVGAALLGDLDLRGNELGQAMGARLHAMHLLPQLRALDGAPVTPAERLAAANMHGAEAEGLSAIRRKHFPDGELDDGGGAIPPTAAGLVPSHAEEECSLGDPSAAYAAADAAAASVLPSDAAAGSAAVAARLLVAPQIAASGPLRQLQLLRAVWSWVLGAARPPRPLGAAEGASAGSGADDGWRKLGTWQVGCRLLGGDGESEDEEAGDLEQALLPGVTGTWAERAAALAVALARAAGLEARQISGFWKDGSSVSPGGRLLCHNHSWCAAKVNGRWRLLDPAHAVARGGCAPFFTPPEAFAYTRLPFEPYWQLLPAPVSADEFWARPEAAVALFEAGGRLLDGGLRSANALGPCSSSSAQHLPAVRLLVAFPVPPERRQWLRLRLVDARTGEEVAGWQPPSAGASGSGAAATACGGAACSGQGCGRGAGGRCQCERRQGQAAGAAMPLVYQQQAVTAGAIHTRFGAAERRCAAHELWAAPPAPGEWRAHVQLVTETPAFMRLAIEGLERTMDVALREAEDVVRVSFVVPAPAPAAGRDEGGCGGACGAGAGESAAPWEGPAPPPAAALEPAPLPAAAPAPAALAAQLVLPVPGVPIEADRTERFEVAFGAAAAVERVWVGAEGHGWAELPRLPAAAPEARDGKGEAIAAAACAVFGGDVVLPRSARCVVRAQLAAAAAAACGLLERAAGEAAPGPSEAAAAGGGVDVLTLAVLPQAKHMVAVPDPCPLPEPDLSHPDAPRWALLLRSLDANGDGLCSRRDMLLSIRRDRQLADHLGMPPRIKAGDGSFDRFLAQYVRIDREGLGRVGLRALAAHLISVKPGQRGASPPPAGAQHAAGGRRAGAGGQSAAGSRPGSGGRPASGGRAGGAGGGGGSGAGGGVAHAATRFLPAP